jgi:hypothetical protein
MRRRSSHCAARQGNGNAEAGRLARRRQRPSPADSRDGGPEARLCRPPPNGRGGDAGGNEVLRGRDRQKRSPTARAKRMAKGERRKAPPQKVLGRASPATVHAEADSVNAHSRTAAAAGCKDASDEAGARVRLSRATTHRSFTSEDADEGRGATDCRQHRAVAGASREGGSRLKLAGTRRSCTGRMHALRSGEPT